MFIPEWIIHLLATIVFVFFLFHWAFATHGNYDFSPSYKIPVTLLCYACYWIVVLLIKI